MQLTEEDRKALLGHKNGNIISHDAAVELDQLIKAAYQVSETDSCADDPAKNLKKCLVTRKLPTRKIKLVGTE